MNELNNEEDDFSWPDYRDAMRQRSTQRRANNRENGIKILTKDGFKFETLNAGAHLVIEIPEGKIDFWPGTGRYMTRFGAGVKGRGIFNLRRYIRTLES